MSSVWSVNLTLLSRSTSLRCVLACILAALMLQGCATPDTSHADEQASASQRKELNEGYSLLYDAVSGIQNMDKLLYAKVESDRVEKTITDISDYATKLTRDLERITEEFPAIKIDLKPLPELEAKKRELQSSANLKDLAPVIGKTGHVFERRLLLSLSGLLDQLKFQAQIMSEEEPDPALKAVLADAESRFAGLYEEVVTVLNEDYFKHNTYSPPENPARD
tara:strand:+ start:3595 stop:4260 length:666 start_codon:yes stop_codon:yes gene_type:complete